MKSARAGAQRPETLLSILPLSEGPPVRTRAPCSTTKLVGRWQGAENCSHWTFLGAQKAEKELEYFLKCKAVEQIEFTGSRFLFSKSTEAPNLASGASPPSSYFPFMRCCHSIILPELVFTPLTFKGGGEEARRAGGWGLAKEEKHVDLE